MRKRLEIAALFMGAAGMLLGQQPTSATPIDTVPNGDETRVYYAGSGVTTPEILPGNLVIAKSGSCQALNGTVKLDAVVDARGLPTFSETVSETSHELGKLASRLFEDERFKPGQYHGKPVAAAIETTFGLQTCVLSGHSGDKGAESALVLRAHPEQGIDLRTDPAVQKDSQSNDAVLGVTRLEKNDTPPKPISYANPVYPDRARKKKIEGLCVVGLTVDTKGNPQDVFVVKSANPELDENAIKAVKQYRFTPATHNGQPIPVIIQAEVNFRLY